MLRAHAESVCADYASAGLTLGPHPWHFAPAIKGPRCHHQRGVGRLQHGLLHTTAIVTTRKRPSSTNNVTFVTLEDETGNINLVVWQRLAEQQHQAPRGCTVTRRTGSGSARGQVIHVIAHHLRDYTAMLGPSYDRSRDFIEHRIDAQPFQPDRPLVEVKRDSLAAQAACTVLRNRHAIVIGPTPPGTGVIAPATASDEA